MLSLLKLRSQFWFLSVISGPHPGPLPPPALAPALLATGTRASQAPKRPPVPPSPAPALHFQRWGGCAERPWGEEPSPSVRCVGSRAHPSHVPTTWPRVSVPSICFCSGGTPSAPQSLLSPSPRGHQAAALHGAAPLPPGARGGLPCSPRGSWMLLKGSPPSGLPPGGACRPSARSSLASRGFKVLLLQLVRGGLSAPRWAGEVVSLSGLCRPLSQVGTGVQGGGRRASPRVPWGTAPRSSPHQGVSLHILTWATAPAGSCMFCGWRHGAGAAGRVTGGPWGDPRLPGHSLPACAGLPPKTARVLFSRHTLRGLLSEGGNAGVGVSALAPEAHIPERGSLNFPGKEMERRGMGRR